MNKFYRFVMLLALFIAVGVTAKINAAVYLNPAACNADNPKWYAYTWSTVNDSEWIASTDEGDLKKFDTNPTKPNIVFVRMDPNATEPSWDSKWNQTYDLVIVDEGTYTLTGYEGSNMTGYWTEPTIPETGADKPVWQQSDPNGENYLKNRRALTGRHCMINKLINVVGVGSWVQDLNNVTDENIENVAEMPTIVNAGVTFNPVISVRDTKNHYAKGTTAGFTINAGSSSTVLSLDVIKAMSIMFLCEGKNVGTVAVKDGQSVGGVGLSLITIPGSDEVNVDIAVTAPAQFDEMLLGFAGGVNAGVGNLTYVKYAFVGGQIMNTITNTSMQNYAASHDRLPFTLDQGHVGEWGYWAGSDLINDDLTDGVAWGVIGIGSSLSARVGAAPDRNDPDQSQPFKKGSVVGFKYSSASALNLSLGNAMRIRLYKGEWKQTLGVWKWDLTEVQDESAKINVLGLNLVSGEENTISIIAKEDFSHALIDFPTGLSINLGGSKVFYGYVCDPAEVYHHCDLMLSADANVCESKAQYQLTANGGIPVTWSIDEQPDGGMAQIDATTGLLTGLDHADGTYVVRGTAADGCYDLVYVTSGLFGSSGSCDMPISNEDGEDYELSNMEYTDAGGALIEINEQLQDKENILNSSYEDYAIYQNVLNGTVVENLPIVASKVIKEANTVKVKLIGSNRNQKLRFAVDIPAGVSFNEFVLWKSGVLDLSIDKFKIYYAFDEPIDDENEPTECVDPLGCDAKALSSDYGATLNSNEIQFAGAVNVANVIDNLSYLVDGDLSTGVSITNTVSLGTGVILAIDLGRVYTPSHQLGMVVDSKTYLARVKAGNWITMKTYLNGVEQESQSDWGVLGVNAIGYGDKSYIFMNPTKNYDEVRITIAAIADALGFDQKYYDIFVRNDYDQDGTPDCKDDDSCSEEYTLDEEATTLAKTQDYPDGNLVLHRNAFGNQVKIAIPSGFYFTPEAQAWGGSKGTVLYYEPLTQDDDDNIAMHKNQYYIIKPFREPDLTEGTYTAKDGNTVNAPVYFIPKVTYLREDEKVGGVVEPMTVNYKAYTPTTTTTSIRPMDDEIPTEENAEIILHGSQVYLDGQTNPAVAPGDNYLYGENNTLTRVVNSAEPMLGFRFYAENKTPYNIYHEEEWDIPTGIVGIINNPVVKRTGIYTIDGRLIRLDNSTSGLPAGIYIVDGKKVVVMSK